jgi:quercetin dioxygenase-like cupin family protein
MKGGDQVRRLVTGADAADRSCLLEETSLALKAARSGSHHLARVYETDAAPPSAGQVGHDNFVDVGLGSGILRWLVITFEPNAEFPMHHTDTIDCVLVLEGSVELGLDDGWHPLEARDCVVIPAVEHSWKSGPAGCQLSVTAIGTRPRDD